MRSSLRTALLAGAVALAGGCTTWVDSDGNVSVHLFGGARAERSEAHDLDLSSGESLCVDGVAGDVSVRVEPTERPHLDAHFDAGGSSDEVVQRRLAATRVEIERSGRTLHVSARTETPAEGPGGIAHGSWVLVSLKLVVPPDLAVAVDTSGGDVTLAGPLGDVRVHAPHGDVSVSDAGAVTVESSGGSVTLKRVRGAIAVDTRYDSITIDDAEGEIVRATTTSGAVRLRDVRAGRIEVATSYDSVALERITARSGRLDVDVQSSSGDVRVEAGGRGTWRLATTYGDVLVRHAAGTLEARTSSGAIHLEDITGEVVARTSYDDVALSGELHAVDAESSSGAISVTAQPGSSVERPWRLATNYDDVTLALPQDLHATVEARARGGEVRSDYTLTRARSDSKEATALIGGGGGEIRVETSNGDVILRQR